MDEHCIRRIAAVLLALADLAERASCRSPAVRSLVLWLLRSGAVLARSHLAGLTQPAAGQSDPPRLPFTDDSAAGAMRIAADFRNLAAALATLAAQCLGTLPQAVAGRWGGPRLRILVASCPSDAFRFPTAAVERLDSS